MNTLSPTFTVSATGTRSAKGLSRRYLPFLRTLFCGLLFTAIAGNSAFGASQPGVSVASAADVAGTNAELNGARMVPGATLFPGDVVQMGPNSLAALQFGKSLVWASSLTEFVVQSQGVSLRSGRIQVRASGGGSFAVTGAFFHVNIAPSGGVQSSTEAVSAGIASTRILLSGNHAEVSTVSGVAEIMTAGNVVPYTLHAGKAVNLDAPGGAANSDAVPAQTSAATPTAGQVSRVLPQVQIDRSTQQLMAEASTPIYWNDDLHSGATGRARIALQDGSVLNLGSNSELRVLQHDAQAQQTSLDLAVGRMRGQIMKLTRPGAKFEIRTPVGVAGLVGTDFSLLVTPDYTELMVFEGVVRFTVSSSGQAISVTAGMKIRISRAGTVEGPSSATPAEIQTAKNLTNTPGGPGQNVANGKPPSILLPVVVSAAATVAVVAVSIPLVRREPVSPETVGDVDPTPVKPVVH